MNYLFSNLICDLYLVESLSKLGIVRPSYTQYNFIKSFIDESSIIFQSKSGTGKTVAFCISVLHKIIIRRYLEIQRNSCFSVHLTDSAPKLEHLLGDVVIIVPTRELAYQIYLFFVSLKKFLPIIKSILLIGNTDIFKVVSYMKKENVNIVISTPGRFRTILKCNPGKNIIGNHGYKSTQKFFKTHTLIFDEADVLFDEQFYDQTKYICSKISNPFVQIIAVSATFIKPHLKLFEDMISAVDQNYINNFVKSHSTITENIMGIDARLTYHIYNLLISKKIEKLDNVLDYLSRYERVFQRIFLSSSYPKSTINTITESSDRIDQSGVDDSDDNVDIDVFAEDKCVYNSNVSDTEYASVGNKDRLDQTISDSGYVSDRDDVSSETSVIETMTFYYAVVKDAPNIVMQIGYKIEELVKILSTVRYKKCIIFSNQSHSRAQAYGVLKYFGHTCYIISSRMSHTERLMMLYELNSVESVIILCTDIMSRGIGLSNVDLVINMDIPGSKEIFLHRSGRTGRFGSKGVCVSICMESEVETYNYFLFALNFKSDTVKSLYDSDGCVNGNVSDVLIKTIDFVNLDYELLDICNAIKPSLSSSMLNTEKYKFNVSIIGFISDTDMMLFNTCKTQALMYIDVIDYEVIVTIKRTEENHVLFESFCSKVELIYSENANNANNYNKNIKVTHIILKMGYSRIFVSLPLVEFIKLLNCQIKQLQLVKLEEHISSIQIDNNNNNNKTNCYRTQLNEKISQLFESKCSLNYYDFKLMLDGANDDKCDDINIGPEEQLLESLDALSIRNNEIVKYYTDYINERFHDLVKHYIRCTETVSAFKESTFKEVNINTIRNHFIKTHVSLWNSLNNQ